MSFEAFEVVRLVEKLPLKICSLATWGDSFIVGTYSSKNEAHLLVYSIKESQDYDRMYEAKLVKTLKKYTTKPITQLAVVPEYNIFLGLSDSEVFFADLDGFQMRGQIPRSKGANYFAVDWQKLRGRGTIGYGSELRLCVSTKKKLQLYEYKKNAFVPIKTDLNFPDTPRAFAWVGDSLIACIKKDLYHVQLEGDSKELFSIGSSRSEPCLLPLLTGDILVLKDEMQISLDSQAKPTQPNPLVWSEQPSSIEHVHPFVVAIMPRGIEIRALEEKIQIQVVKNVEAMKFIASAQNTVIASTNQVYLLEPKPYDMQVSHLVQRKHFDLALKIADLISESPTEKIFRRHEILRRCAFHQFTQHKFVDSLTNYLEVNEDPVHVIGLYPNLLPADLRQSLSSQHPTKPPTLSGVDLENGMKSLITYLTQTRYKETQKLQKHRDTEATKAENRLSDDAVKKLTERLQLIDTTLLKCYVKTGNNTLIGSLVRLPENYLHITECERVLKAEDKFQELIDLYNSKKLHKRALQLLSKFAQVPNSPMSGVWPTIEYLNKLSTKYFDLVLEYSILPLKNEPHDAIRIFTDDVEEVRAYPRQHVLDHLSQHAPDLTITYLEHIIDRWDDTTVRFHNKLIQLYQTRVIKLLDEYKMRIKGKPRARAGEEPGDLGVLRTKLLRFLATSRHYVAAEHITSFPQDDLFEERALLLSRLEKHEVALAIYAHVLKEPELAEDYCRRNYDPEREESREVYLCLIKMYLSPPNLADYGIRLPDGSQPEANVEDALKVLASHHGLIDTAKVLDLLPADTPLSNIRNFLATVLQEKTLLRRNTQLMKSLLGAEYLQVAQQKIKEQAPIFVVNEESVCAACNRRLGTSAFARYPDGEVEHYYCAKENIAKEQIASPQPQVIEQEPSLLPSSSKDLYLDTNPF